jgi:hypothetical protein
MLQIQVWGNVPDITGGHGHEDSTATSFSVENKWKIFAVPRAIDHYRL